MGSNFKQPWRTGLLRSLRSKGIEFKCVMLLTEKSTPTFHMIDHLRANPIRVESLKPLRPGRNL